MGVEAHVEPLGQLSCGAHEPRRHRERRARRQGDAHHGPVRPVMMQGHQAFGVGEDLVVVLHHAVGREAAVLLGQAHRAPGGVKAQAHLGRRGDLGRDQVTATTGVHVQVVGGRGGAAQCQLGQADPGRDVRRFLVESAPHGIQRPQPVEEIAAQRGREGPGEVLVDVVMGVHEPRRHQAAVGLHGPVRPGRFLSGAADPHDQPVGDRHPSAGDLTPLGVERGDQVGPGHEQVDACIAFHQAAPGEMLARSDGRMTVKRRRGYVRRLVTISTSNRRRCRGSLPGVGTEERAMNEPGTWSER